MFANGSGFSRGINLHPMTKNVLLKSLVLPLAGKIDDG